MKQRETIQIEWSSSLACLNCSLLRSSEALLKAAGLTGDGCKKVMFTETCACKTDLCNDPSKKSSASTQSASQLVAYLAASFLFKILLA